MNELKFMQTFVLEKAEHESLETREKLYRALAPLAPNPTDTVHLTALADELRDLRLRCAQMLLSFRVNP